MHIITLLRYYRRIRRQKAVGMAFILTLLLISVTGNAICFYLFDRQHNDGLQMSDALWYSVISITTIGYGDFSATSPGARLGTVFFVVVLGLGAFTVMLGMAIDWITDLSLREQHGMGTAIAKDHILIVNYPSTHRVVQLIQELKSDPQHEGREIVIVTDQIDTLPFKEDHVVFVRGPVLEQETFERARIHDARMAIILATSYADPNSDAVVASTVAIIDTLRSDIYIVAECLNDKHRILFDSVNCDAIVFSLKISGNLLAQEVHDPGVSQLVEVITSNVRGTTLFSTEITESSDELSYHQMARNLLDKDINLICVNRGSDSLTSFSSLYPNRGDRAIYAAADRLNWDRLLEQARS